MANTHGGAALAAAVEKAYQAGQDDYHLEPMSLLDAEGAPVGKIHDGDEVVFCCRRGEREIQLTEAFTEADFKGFSRDFMQDVRFVIMTMYHEKFKNLPIAFAPEKVKTPLAEVISNAGLTQFHASESEKYAHVTFFFNGGENEPFPGETDDCVPSPKGIAFDTKPELSLPELSKKVKGAVETGYDFILTNFVNGDVIGHTANADAKIEACKVLGKYVDEVSRFAKEHGYFVAVTADHGNIETLRDKKGNPHVAHTSNLIPFLVVDPQGRDVLLRDGTMQDVAPTVLSVLGLPKPEVMTGESLITTPGITNPKMLLIICDGYGFGSADDNDAVWSADNPEWKKMLWTYPNCTLRAFGPYVGLQEGKPGNSEAGHINMGAGRVVPQDDVRMDNAIKDGSFKTNPVFMTSIRNAVEKDVPLHLICLLTKKSSHGCIDYPIMLTEMAKEAGVKETYLHIIFDGRSTEPGSAPELLKWLDEKLEEIGTGKIVDGIGRGIALDRDHNYEKTEKAYNNLVFGTGTAYRE